MIRNIITMILFAAILLMAAIALARTQDAVEYDWKMIRVVDGDTVQFEAPWVPQPIAPRISVRVYGVDTPEKGHRAQCPHEALLGQRATDYTKNMLASSKEIRVMVRDWDKYGGRILGDIMIDGRSLRTSLIAEGLAREYFGEAKTSWCN
jgi:micrococcal nuclease